MSDNSEREREIFGEALELGSLEEQRAFVKGACGGDEPLRQAVEGLLEAYSQAGGFIPPRLSDPRDLPCDSTSGEGPGTVIGRYKLLEKIGEGGMGVVYMAQQEEPVRRRVALKIIKLGMDSKQVVARFEAERQALALMDHPNIAKVLDGGATETGRPYFVMELVQGVPITEFCDRNRLPARERIKLFITVCQAIQSAHQKGIIHRDLKPTNILVTLDGGVPVPMVIDFGVAKATQQKLTEKTVFTNYATMIGTPAYMSPEQAEMSRLDVDTRSDIYGLGVLLYELLTGTTPFPEKRLRSASYREMQRIILEEEPERPSTRVTGELAARRGREAGSGEDGGQRTEVRGQRSAFDSDLDWIVMKCLEKDRARRYETANGLAADLKRHLNNEPVVARPPSTVYRLQKAWRRNKVVFTAAAVMAGALVVGTGVSSWQAIVASRARNAESQQRLAAQTERDKAQAAQKEAERAKEAETSVRIEAVQQLYAAKMNLAQQAWDQNNIGQLRQLLEETQESPYRGFEWYYWQPLTHLALKTLRGHLSGVMSVAFSPDGRRIVTGSADQTAKVWEAASGRELHTFKGHSGRICSVAFSPDGQRIVTGSDDGTAKVWEAASGQVLVTLRGHTDDIWSAAFSPDGQRIVTGSGDKTAKVWDTASGKELFALTGHRGWIRSVAFSPDGQRIVTGSWDKTAKVWDAASGRELFALKGRSGQVTSVAFSPDGQRIVTGSEDGTAILWEAASGHELVMLKGHSNGILSVAFSPDGQRIVTGSLDMTARVWEAAKGNEPLTLEGHSAEVFSVAFSPDGQRIVTGSWDGTAKLWEAAKGKEVLTLNRHGDEITSATASSPDAKGRSARVFSAAFSPDGQRIVTGSTQGTAKVWEAASGRELLTLTGHNDWIIWAAFSPDGQRIVTASEDQTAKVWDAASGTNLLTLRGHTSEILSVAFSPDGQRIVTGSHDKTARVWDAASGKELHRLTWHSDGVWQVAFSPDGQRIVIGSRDTTATVWETASGKRLLTLKGHSGIVYSVAFSPNGQRIVTGSDDGTAKLWEAATGRELLTLKGHKGGVTSVAFSPDGERIVTGSRDHTARVWQAATGQQVAAWQEEERAAAQHLAALERERTAEQERQIIARTRDSIKQWLILAPINLATGQSGAQGLDIEQIEGEGQLRPKAGEAGSIGGGELKWREVALTNEVIDFNALLGQETTQSVAYAVCYLQSEAEHRGLQMLVGSDDEAKVYLDGKPVYTNVLARPFLAEEDKVPDIALNAGLNVLVFKVVNETREWKGSIRFTDAQGNPVNGIKVTLDPEAKD